MLFPQFVPGVLMSARFVLVTLLFSMQVVGQTTPTSTKPAMKPRTAAVSPPTAIIDTSAGKMTCTLFPDKAPIGVANFVGLARGTKDWINPRNGQKIHGVPPSNGTIFHRAL